MNMKRWLIRTTDKKILGPVLEEKVIDLVKENKLFPTDELCLGNDIWFFVKEHEYICKYLNMNIEEIKDPLVPRPSLKEKNLMNTTGEEIKYPSDENVSYPELNHELSQGNTEGSTDNEKIEQDIPQRRATDKKKR